MRELSAMNRITSEREASNHFFWLATFTIQRREYVLALCETVPTAHHPLQNGCIKSTRFKDKFGKQPNNGGLLFTINNKLPRHTLPSGLTDRRLTTDSVYPLLWFVINGPPQTT